MRSFLSLIFASLVCMAKGHRREGFFRWHCNRCFKLLEDDFETITRH